MHIQVKFLLLLGLAIVCATLDVNSLAILFLIMVWAALFISADTFIGMLKRVRWLIAVMLLIYAYSIPGQYFDYWFFETRPTYEGLQLGVMQMMRLVTMIAGVSCLIGLTPRSNLIGGIYQLARPFRWLKLDAQRFAIRVGLTLHYVETVEHQRQLKITSPDLFLRLLGDISKLADNAECKQVEIDVEPLTSHHISLMAILVLLFGWILL